MATEGYFLGEGNFLMNKDIKHKCGRQFTHDFKSVIIYWKKKTPTKQQTNQKKKKGKLIVVLT